MIQEVMANLGVELQRLVNGECSISAVLFGLSLLFIAFYLRTSRPKSNLPPGPVCLPIVGYLPFLGKEPYKVLDKLSKSYGKVFGLYLGRTYVVILGNYAAVKEALSKSSTTDKPSNMFDFIPDALGFSGLNGEDWVEQRRYVMRAMRDIGLGRTLWEDIVQEEVDDFVKILYAHNGCPLDVCNPLSCSVTNTISSLVFGKRIPQDDPARLTVAYSIDAVIRAANQASVRNYFPLLYKVLVKLGIGKYAKMHQDMVTFNDYIKKEIDECKIKLTTRGDSNIFIDEYLKEMQSSRKNVSHSSFTDVNLCGNAQGLIVGGADTTKTSLNWLFLAMANFPDIQDKVHKEIQVVLGKEGRAQWLKKAELPYTYAVILECQRWMPIVPLNSARIPSEDITIGGYDIPKGTPIIGNYWGIHYDPSYWKDPEEFIPERFLTNDGKQLIYKQDSYLPFSYGRRNCPGETVAMIEILLYFTAVIQQFEVLPPAGEKPNLEGIQGIAYNAVPQELRFIPRK